MAPVLLMPGFGLIHKNEFTPEKLEKLERDGLALTEGPKGVLALCSVGLNACSTGGCSGGSATLDILSKFGIEPHFVKWVFADTDILTNPHVTAGYKKLLKDCSGAEVLIYPPQKVVSEDGMINYEKYSPDDWIEEGYDMEITFKKVTRINIESIEQYHEKITKASVSDSSEMQIKLQRGSSNKAAIDWLSNYFKVYGEPY